MDGSTVHTQQPRIFLAWKKNHTQIIQETQQQHHHHQLLTIV
jgi:hypothetical protein